MANPTGGILITGGASGIGEGLAIDMAKSGRPVLVADVRFDGAAAVAARIRASGGRAEPVALDVTSD